MQLHWDGNNDSVDERNLSASLGTGVTPVTIDHARLERRQGLDLERAAAGVPLRRSTRREAARGQRALPRAVPASATRTSSFKEGQTSSARGWATGGADRGDRHRSRTGSTRTPMSSRRTSTRSIPNSPYRFTRISARPRATPTSRWTASGRRAPYLHNGAVPTLRDLLDAPEAQAQAVLPRLRRVRPGARSASSTTCPTEGGVRFFEFDTARPGNGNSGHLVRHRRCRRRQGRDRRVHEDVLAGSGAR